MYNHRILSLFLFVSSFYVTSLVSTGLAWILLTVYFSPSAASASSAVKAEPDVNASDVGAIKTEDSESDAFDLSDTPRTFPTYSRQPPLRFTGPSYAVKAEEEPDRADRERTTSIKPLLDEDEDDDDAADALGASRAAGRRTDSGLGTSLEEGPGGIAGLQRRRSKGRRAP